MKFDFSRHICAAGQSRVRTPPLGDAPPPYCLTYLSKPAWGRSHQLPKFIELIKTPLCESWIIVFINNYFNKLLWLQNLKLFTRQNKIFYILDNTILILYRKLYINIVSIIVLNIEARQYNIKNNLAMSCSSRKYFSIQCAFKSNFKYFWIKYTLNKSTKMKFKILRIHY